MEVIKDFNTLSLDEQVNILLWARNNDVDVTKFYKCSLIDFVNPIDYMDKQGFIGFHGNTAKDMIPYITEKGLERIKDYVPPKVEE